MKDFSHPRQPRQDYVAKAIPTFARYCLEGGIKHLVFECPLNLERKDKAILNLLETILSSSGNENKQVRLIMAVIRIQS